MTRRKSIAATTAILALSAARCDCRTITQDMDEHGKHGGSHRRVKKVIRKTRGANHVDASDVDSANQWRRQQKTRQYPRSHQQQQPLASHRQIKLADVRAPDFDKMEKLKSIYPRHSTTSETSSQTARFAAVLDQGKSGKSSLKGKSPKRPPMVSMETPEQHHQQRPPQQQQYGQQQYHEQQNQHHQYQQQQQVPSEPSSWSDIIATADENLDDYDDDVFAWSQDDALVPIANVIVNDGDSQVDISQLDVSQVNVSQVDANQINTTLLNTSQVDATPVNMSQVHLNQHDLLSPQELILLQYENMAEDTDIGDDDDDTGMFQWMEDDSAWINDGHDFDDDDNKHDDGQHQIDVVPLPPPSRGKASKLFKDEIHRGKSGKGSKNGSSNGGGSGGNIVWSGGYSAKPSPTPMLDGGHSGKPSPKPTRDGAHSGKSSTKPTWAGGQTEKPSLKPTWGGNSSSPFSTHPTSGSYPSRKPLTGSSEPSKFIISSRPTEGVVHLPTTSRPNASSEGPTPHVPTEEPIGPIIIPPTPSPSDRHNFPYLTWRGIDTCSFFYPCPICTGDCDVDSDCQVGLECFKRGVGETVVVPGCRAGGDGDIPGADFCFDPRSIVTPTVMPSAGGGGGSSSTTSPTTKGSEGSIETYAPSTGKLASQAPSSASGENLPPLTFLGVNGCSIVSPCDTCEGDCDSDQECVGSLKCYKRADGMKNQVPGCAVGGKGDIAGADYCYDANWGGSVTPIPSAAGGGILVPTMPPFIAFPSMAPINLLLPTSSPSMNASQTSSPKSSPSPLPSISVTISPHSLVPSTLVMPPESENPSIVSASPQTSSPTIMPKAYFIRSMSRTTTKENQALVNDWCVSGALSPDYYQLLLERCTGDTFTIEDSTPIRRIERMDQLWTMDHVGLIHSIYDFNRCMMVQPNSSVLDEAVVEIGPCDAESPLQKFMYNKSKSTLKLLGDRFSPFCVTFLGEVANNGSPLVMERCESKDRFGWDFIPENMYGSPSPSPIATFPPLMYKGRDGCNSAYPCEACAGDCDSDEECQAGLMCFQRAKDETTQVPGCKAGGVQDIPGADYCFDPSSPLPPLIWLGSGKNGCTVSNPCNRCVGPCVKDADCKGNLKCFSREERDLKQVPGCRHGGEDDIQGGDYCYDPNDKVQPTVEPSRMPMSLIPLRWRGSDGCSPENPCPVCTGDCDEDNDCESSLMCFRRYAGDRSQVPGCLVGGLGDIPGGDYCFDPQVSPGKIPTYSPSEQALGTNGSN